MNSMLKLGRLAKLNIFIVVVIILSANYAYCEEAQKEGRTSDRFFTEMGFITGFGSGSIPEGTYQPIFLIGHFGVDLKRYFQGLEEITAERFPFFSSPRSIPLSIRKLTSNWALALASSTCIRSWTNYPFMPSEVLDRIIFP